MLPSNEVQKIENLVRERYQKAKESAGLVTLGEMRKSAEAISNAIPFYDAMHLKFGAFKKDNFAVMFVDMRDSTSRAIKIGPEKTFTSMHAFLTAALAVIEYRKGYVIDIPGDGLMCFWGGNDSGISHSIACQNAGLAGSEIRQIVKEVVNNVLSEDKIWNVQIGVGVDFGDVIVTKVGTDKVFDVKAYGNCINKASKLCRRGKTEVGVVISKAVERKWPTSDEGKIKFSRLSDVDDAYLLSDS